MLEMPIKVISSERIFGPDLDDAKQQNTFLLPKVSGVKMYADHVKLTPLY
jgi:hypothetical protein